MSIRVLSGLEGGKGHLSLDGRFDYGGHKEFRSAYEELLSQSACKEIVIDMQKVEYVDSAALGMLLLLRDRAKSAGKSIVIAGCHGVALQVLEVANFNKLFDMV
ncbi:STAS domain-containing protein [Ampullimonas aquatilis]|uniref:STAS domain-containing protein n=1 Tax=Ampullimonas aquatilis TaxID=1341549 RepID=UPI003C74E7CC